MLIRTTAAAWALALGLPAAAQHAGHTPSSAGSPASAAAAPRLTVQAGPSAAQAASAPASSAPETLYRSAFKGYKRFTDEPVQSWKAANDRVGQIGGWRTYAREAAGGEAGEPAGTGGHAGHGNEPAGGQNPPRAGAANTERPFGQTEMTNPPTTAPRPTPAQAPAANPPAAAASAATPTAAPQPGAGHSQHH